MLTIQELEKYKACLYMESVRPTKEQQVEDLNKQILFIRTHGKGNTKFYPVTWFQANPKRTRAVYYKTYEAYSLEFNKRNRKYIRAEEKRQELEARIVEQVTAKA